ncbi:hypothetical protein Tco_0189485 [Tanacetum coccineum]
MLRLCTKPCETSEEDVGGLLLEECKDPENVRKESWNPCADGTLASMAELLLMLWRLEDCDYARIKICLCLPWERVVHFGKSGKLTLEASFRELSRVHSIFHVSNLKKCYANEPLAVLLDGLHFDDKLQFVEEPVEIVDREVKRLKQSRIPFVKVRWNSKRGPEFTWECEDQFRKKYPHQYK